MIRTDFKYNYIPKYSCIFGLYFKKEIDWDNSKVYVNKGQFIGFAESIDFTEDYKRSE